MNNTELKSAIELALLNPSLMQKKIYDSLDTILEGNVDVVNATNPFAYLLEVNCATAAATASNHQSLIQLLYPLHSVDMETLYRFMSDKDYEGRFATPSVAPFVIAIRKEEVLNRAVQVDDTKVKKIVIPRNTTISAGGLDFGFQYPLEIRIMAHGGLQLVWNVEKESPLLTLTSNVVDWTLVDSPNGEFIIIKFELQQFTLDHREEVLNSSVGFVKTYSFVDQFWHCRVYHSTNGTTWNEIDTTHTRQVYDPLTLTACLKVVDNTLRVEIPQIYFSNGLATGNLRVDIYTTKGKLEQALDGLLVNSYVATWYDYDNDDAGVYSAPLSILAEWSCFSEGAATGGTDVIDFATLRKRVISNGLTDSTEVSPAQLEVSLEKKGYGLVKNIDLISKLIYLATRSLPNPEKNQIISGANCTVAMLAAKMEELVQISTVVDNSTRITLLPTTLYKFVDGKVTICDNAEVVQLKQYAASNPEALANALNLGDYIYSPFHYVMDTTQDFFECRGYYLENPQILGRRFAAENESAEIEIATESFSFERTDYGWDLYVVTRSGASYQDLDDTEVYCQLAIQPVNESYHAYLNGELYGMQGKERVWRFKIETNFDFDYGHNLTLTNFRMFGNDPSEIGVELESKLQIIHVVTNGYPVTVEHSAIDSILGTEILPENAYGVVRDELSVSFGSVLDKLWSNARTVVSDEDYLRYTENVPVVWEETQYLRDAGTGAINWVVAEDGLTLISTVLHNKGDVKYLADGVTPEYAHQIGDIKYDDTGKPIVKNKRALLRQVELFFLEGVLNYATNTADVEYREGLAKSVVTYLEDDIASFDARLLGNSWLYFTPESTLGQTKAIINDARVDYIPSNLSFDVTTYLSATQFANSSLRDSIATTIKSVIATALTRDSFSISQVVAEIREALGDDAVPVDIAGLGTDRSLTTFTLYDKSTRCGVKHKLVVEGDETLRLEDDINITWIRHSEN